MDQYNRYVEFQHKLLSLDESSDLNELKDFIDSNNFFKNGKKTLSTLRLISSIIYSNPKLLGQIVQLLNLFEKIDINSDLLTEEETNKVVIKRTIIIYIILILSNHMNISDIEDELKSKYISIIDPINALSGKMNNYKLAGKSDYNLIMKMADEEKIKHRNQFHSTHQIVQAIIEDDDEQLLHLISRNNYDINEEIPSSIFEFHKILHHANPIQYAAFLGSIHCFKLLLLKSDYIEYEKLYEFAIIGGNYDIIHLIESKCKSELITSNHNLLNSAILYFKNEMIEYLINNYDIPITIENYINCIYASNYEALIILKKLNELNSFEFNEAKENDSNKLYRKYLNFMISIPSIVGIEYNNSWKEMIIDSALNGKKFNVIGYIFKNRILNNDDECDNVKIALIIAFQYHYKEIISIFKEKSNIEDLMPSKDYEYEYEYENCDENENIDYWDDWENWNLYEEWDYQQYWHYYFQEADNWKEEDEIIPKRIKTSNMKNHFGNRNYKKYNIQKKKNNKKKIQCEIKRKISNDHKEFMQKF